MQASFLRQSCRHQKQKGFTLLELIIATMMLLILTSAAISNLRFTALREREWELRADLREMRNAIDRYKDYADKNLVQTAVGTNGYPPSLDILVKGVEVGPAGQNVRFLRRIPIDPVTQKKDWVLRSLQDDEDSGQWSGDNVFDVHSGSHAKALDGSDYSTW
jgi:general secretion pathway protein G